MSRAVTDARDPGRAGGCVRDAGFWQAAVLATLVAILPLANVERLLVSILQSGLSTAIIVAIVGLHLVRARLAGSESIYQLSPPVLGCGIAFALFAHASQLWSPFPLADPDRALLAALAVGIACLSAATTSHVRLVAGGWLLGAIVQAAVGMAQFFRQRPAGLGWLGERQWETFRQADAVIAVGSDFWVRAPGLSSHPNLLGAYLVVAAAIAVAFVVSSRGRGFALYLLSLAIVLVGLLVTFSRAGLLICALVLAATIWRARAARILSRRRMAALLALVVVVVSAFVLAYGELFAARSLVTAMNSGWDATPYELADLDERLSSRSSALDLIRAYPIGGVGAGAYVVGVYSAPLWIAAELGLMGLALWLVWVGWAAASSLRRVVALPADPFALASATGLAGVLFGSLLNPDPWTSSSGSLFLAVLVGFGAARSGTRPAGEASPTLRGRYETAL